MERASTTPNLYEYPAEIADAGGYITGFDVHATDGPIGPVEAASYSHGRSFLLVGTDSWIVREKRLLPAGIVRGATRETRKLFIGMTKDEIRAAPEYDEAQHRDNELAYLEAVGRYYEPWTPNLNLARSAATVPLEFHSVTTSSRRQNV